MSGPRPAGPVHVSSDLPGLLLRWLAVGESDWHETVKWRRKLSHQFPPVEHWLLNVAESFRLGRGFFDPAVDEALLAFTPVTTRDTATAVVAICRQSVERDDRTRIFGEQWSLHRPSLRAAVPVGTACVGCAQPVREWQRGRIIPTLDLSRDEVWHENCRLRLRLGDGWIYWRVRGGGLEPDRCPACRSEWRPLQGGLISDRRGTNWRCHVCDHRWPAP